MFDVSPNNTAIILATLSLLGVIVQHIRIWVLPKKLRAEIKADALLAKAEVLADATKAAADVLAAAKRISSLTGRKICSLCNPPRVVYRYDEYQDGTVICEDCKVKLAKKAGAE